MGFQYECALQIAALEAKTGGADGAGAFAALQAGWDRLERWLGSDLLAGPVASAVLFRYAEAILRSRLSKTKYTALTSLALSLAVALSARLPLHLSPSPTGNYGGWG